MGLLVGATVASSGANTMMATAALEALGDPSAFFYSVIPWLNCAELYFPRNHRTVKPQFLTNTVQNTLINVCID